MMKQMVVTYDTEVLHTIKSFSNASNHELFSCAPPFSEILDPLVHTHTRANRFFAKPIPKNVPCIYVLCLYCASPSDIPNHGEYHQGIIQSPTRCQSIELL